jgi:TolA-binding protein
MKTVLRVALCAVLILGCKSSASEMTDLKAQVDDLSKRVKYLEDDVMKADKQMIQQQQAMQEMHDQVRTMQGYFDKLQYQSTAPH